MRILVVCIGNICRSPIAEGLLKFKAKQKGLDWVIDSAGTESYHVGEAPHILSQLVCSENGIDISECRARKFVFDDFVNFDIIYAMAKDVYESIESIGTMANDSGKVHMEKILYFMNELRPGNNGSVPDPYLGQEEDFRDVYTLIDIVTTKIIDKYSK